MQTAAAPTTAFDKQTVARAPGLLGRRLGQGMHLICLNYSVSALQGGVGCISCLLVRQAPVVARSIYQLVALSVCFHLSNWQLDSQRASAPRTRSKVKSTLCAFKLKVNMATPGSRKNAKDHPYLPDDKSWQAPLPACKQQCCITT